MMIYKIVDVRVGESLGESFLMIWIGMLGREVVVFCFNFFVLKV